MSRHTDARRTAWRDLVPRCCARDHAHPAQHETRCRPAGGRSAAFRRACPAARRLAHVRGQWRGLPQGQGRRAARL